MAEFDECRCCPELLLLSLQHSPLLELALQGGRKLLHQLVHLLVQGFLPLSQSSKGVALGADVVDEGLEVVVRGADVLYVGQGFP